MSHDAQHPRTWLQRIERTYSAHRYAILFYTLLATFATGPLLDVLGLEAYVLELLLAINVAAAIAPLAARGPRRALLGMLIVAAVVRFSGAWWDRPVLSTASLAVWAIIALAAVGNTFRFVLGAKAIDREHIYAALDAYLVVGLFLGVGYWALENAAPGSFRTLVAADGTAEPFTIPTAAYFSFVTLATLGYGDILPVTNAARGLATVEAMMGQMYLAVLVARLVSLYGRDLPRRDTKS